jgi:hypothetical protein
MTQTSALYSNRITKIYLEYLARNYPEIDTDEVLDYARITRHEVEAPSYWFTQDQMDRLHEILVRRTGNPSIAREAGRFGASTQSLGPAKKYLIGLLNPSSM